MRSRPRLIILKVDSLTVRLKEAESTVEDVGVDKLSDQVINLLHSYFLLCVFTEELRVGVFKYHFDFHADRQDYHWHVESHENAFASILRLKFSLDFGNRDEQLLPMVHVQWKFVELAEDTPVSQVSYETN